MKYEIVETQDIICFKLGLQLLFNVERKCSSVYKLLKLNENSYTIELILNTAIKTNREEV